MTLGVIRCLRALPHVSALPPPIEMGPSLQYAPLSFSHKSPQPLEGREIPQPLVLLDFSFPKFRDLHLWIVRVSSPTSTDSPS